MLVLLAGLLAGTALLLGWRLLAARAGAGGGDDRPLLNRLLGTEDTLARAQRSRRLRIGYAVEAPYAWLDAEGRVTGESPELARLVVERLGRAQGGWQIDFVQVEFGELIHALETGHIDVIGAGLFITPERARRVRFSAPSLRVSGGLLLRREVAAPVPPDPLQLTRQGRRVAVLAGSVEAEALARAGADAHAVQAVPDAASGLQLLLAGRVAGLALSWPTVQRLAATAPDRLQALPLGPTAGAGAAAEVGFAFRPADDPLRQAWNRELLQLLGSPAHRALLAAQGLGAQNLPRSR